MYGEMCSLHVSEKDFYFCHGDHLGSANWITNADGDAVQYIHYAPYGELIANQIPYGYDEYIFIFICGALYFHYASILLPLCFRCRDNVGCKGKKMTSYFGAYWNDPFAFHSCEHLVTISRPLLTSPMGDAEPL